jgi:RNA polymerase sigma-70 factor (ECF subfamily)
LESASRREAFQGTLAGHAARVAGAMNDQHSELNTIIAAVAEGDKHAFRQLYDATAPKLYGVALRLLGRRDHAEEVLQDAFLSVWRNAGQYDIARGSAFAWLAMIVRNKALDCARRRRRRPEASIEDEAAVALAVVGCDALTRIDEEGRDVRCCYQLLPDRLRDIIGLAFFEGLTHDELAARVKAPLGTVKSWVRKGLSLLKECLSR